MFILKSTDFTFKKPKMNMTMGRNRTLNPFNPLNKVKELGMP